MSATTPGADPENISQEQFDALLDWLDPEREKAGARYESIRKRLIRLFICRGFNSAEDLADKAINRVARKLAEIRETYVGDPAHYFYRVATYIAMEAQKVRAPAVVTPKPEPSEDDEKDYACLEECIGKLHAEDRDLVVAYYQMEKHAKIDHRKKLAEQFGLGMNALRIRACRIRMSLHDCVARCRAEMDQS